MAAHIFWNDNNSYHHLSTGDNSTFVSEGEDINQAIISLLEAEGERSAMIVRTLSNAQSITYEATLSKTLFGSAKLNMEELLRS